MHKDMQFLYILSSQKKANLQFQMFTYAWKPRIIGPVNGTTGPNAAERNI